MALAWRAEKFLIDLVILDSCGFRVDQDMDVVRHQDPGMEFVEMKYFLAISDCIEYALGYAVDQASLSVDRWPVCLIPCP